MDETEKEKEGVLMKLDKVTRFEVIEKGKGRRYVKWDCKIEASVQDSGRTLKIFVEADKDGN